MLRTGWLGMLMLGTLSAQAGEEQFTLGRTILLEVGDRGAVIPLVICRVASEIKIKAERNLTLDKLLVTDSNGRTRSVNAKGALRREQETGWLSLGRRYCVKKIEVRGHADGSIAGVKVFGRR